MSFFDDIFKPSPVDLTVDYDEDLLQATAHSSMVQVMILLKKGADPAARDNMPIINISDRIDEDITAVLDRLLQYPAVNVTARNNMVLKNIIMRGNMKALRLLIKYGIDLTAEDNHAICAASKYGHIESVRLLLQHNVDPSARDNYAVIKAAANGDITIVTLLLQRGAYYAAQNHAAIKAAVTGYRTATIQLLALYANRSNNWRYIYGGYFTLYIIFRSPEDGESNIPDCIDLYGAAIWCSGVPHPEFIKSAIASTHSQAI
jgi:ankyrin repeat protein